MKPLLSERQLWGWGSSRWLTLRTLCCHRRGGGSQAFPVGKLNTHPVIRQGLWPHLAIPRAHIRSAEPRPQAVLPATCRKQAVEAELDTCKAKLRAVEAQLLEVLEEKLRLRQEVEAWEVG